MTSKWSDWNRFILFLVFVITVIAMLTIYSVSQAEARITLEHSYSLNPNNLCHALSPDDTASYVAEKLAEMTGEAISPLFSLTIIGGIKNLCTSEEYRDLLPWYYQTQFLGTSFTILMVLIFKDTFLTFLGPFKQPLDAIAEVVHMISGLVALPVGVIYFADGLSNPVASNLTNFSDLIMPPAQAIDVTNTIEISNYFFFGQTFGVTLGLIIFVSLWVLGNILEVFIFLSPIPFVDTCLSAAKATAISIMMLVAYWNPIAGGILAVIILLISLKVFNWSFRLFTFGLIYCGDFLRLIWRKFKITKQGVLAFSGKNIDSINSGILGRLFPYDRNAIMFVYYPYLVLPQKKTIIPCNSLPDEQIIVVKGVISPTLIKNNTTDDSQQISTLFRFPPRYRKLEESIASYLEIPFDDTVLSSQKKGFLSWFKNTI